MANTALSSYSTPRPRVRGSLRQPVLRALSVLLASSAVIAVGGSRAQDVAEAARQERTRKEQPKKSKHVYTDEDLRRAQILIPDDRERVAANRKDQTPPAAQKPAESLDANASGNRPPLGDVARRFRKEKQARRSQSSPFHLPFNEPAFASPVLPAPKLTPSHPGAPPHAGAIARPPSPESAPLRRVDPFTRRFASVAPTSPAPRSAPALPQPSIVPKTNVPAASPLHTLTVQPGDCLWKLALQNLGRGSRWRDLLAANPGLVDPNHLTAGTQLLVPARRSGLLSDVKITVQQGDTLSKIARSHYGQAAAWQCVAQANPQIPDANRIYGGQQLLLPASCKR